MSTFALRKQYVDGHMFLNRAAAFDGGLVSAAASGYSPLVRGMGRELCRRGVSEVVVPKRTFDQLVRSSFAGLFWFDGDYEFVEDVVGVQEFHKSDVVSKLDVFPVGFHQDYLAGDRRPRGRVSVVHGDVVINVGLKCPDGIIGEVVRVMGLGDYEDRLHINSGYHWDAK